MGSSFLFFFIFYCLQLVSGRPLTIDINVGDGGGLILFFLFFISFFFFCPGHLIWKLDLHGKKGSVKILLNANLPVKFYVGNVWGFVVFSVATVFTGSLAIISTEKEIGDPELIGFERRVNSLKYHDWLICVLQFYQLQVI